MKTYALFGSPVAHSMSPAMHNAAFADLGMEARYVAHETDRAASVLEIMEREGISGASITIPLKVPLLELLDDVSESVRRIGAVNTVVRDGDRWTGENTDWIGIDRALRELMGDLKGRKFLVLGAGGTARAALWAVLDSGGRAVVASRRVSEAQKLAEAFSSDACSVEDIGAVDADCFINTTPVGMRFHEEGTPLDGRLLHRFRWGFDVIYTPLETRLVREARDAGCTASGGLAMFVHQGAEQFRLWTGQEPPIAIMRDRVRSILEDEKY